jgi:aspartokinase/homoserine dehydrogenase 1
MAVLDLPIPQHSCDRFAGKVTVHKFGGTSVGGASQFSQVARIVLRLTQANNEKPVIVVSAMSGITTKLYSAVHAAVDGSEYEKIVNEVLGNHVSCVNELASSISSDVPSIPMETKDILLNSIKKDCLEIQKHLKIVSSARHCPDLISDVIVAYGEIWSAQILTALLTSNGISSSWVNARDFLFLSPLSGKDVRVDWKRSHAPFIPSEVSVPVITGFLATSAAGLPTTLKRNGSDHSGAIVANLCSASALTIWTDVNGIFSADPRVVPNARMIESMSYKEAAELAYFGAKVIHPQTMAPCVTKNIPVILRNTFSLDCPGTIISANPGSQARAVTIIPEVGLINVEGSGLFGFSGIAAKLFASVAAADTNVIMITQASSEYSICFAVPIGDAIVCGDAVKMTFRAEIDDGSIEVSVDTSAAIVAAVGDGMHQQIGLLGNLASSLGVNGVNIRALAQGSSERNITFVVSKEDGTKAVSCLHQALV